MASRPAKKVHAETKSTSIEFAALLEDPSIPDLKRDHVFNAEADHLHRNASLRFEIRDETIDGEALYQVVDLNQIPRTWADFEARHGGGPDALKKILRDPQFHQINLFAICDHALNFIEEELGDEIVWPGKGPLILRPHAFEEANAYYDPADDSLSFGYFNTPLERDTVWTCLSHDIVTHELGHAILTALRPLFDIGIQPESSAFHEAFGDLVALFSAFEHKDVLERALGQGGNLRKPQGLADLASQMGSALYGFGHPYLRSALAERYYDPSVLEPHDASEVLTGALYEAIAQVTDYILTLPKKTAKPKITYAEAAKQAACWVRGMFLRTINYLPPTGVSLPQFASLMLKADEDVYSGGNVQEKKVRDLLEGAFTARGLLESTIDFSVPNSLKGVKLPFVPPADGPKYWSSQGLSAYLLGFRNEDWLPDDAIFNRAWIVRSERNIDSESPDDDKATKEVKQTFLYYTYHLYIDGEQCTFGGTIVFDEKGAPKRWVSDPQPMTVSGQKRQTLSDAINDHIAYLNKLWEQERYEALLAMADAWIEGGGDFDVLDGVRGTHVPRGAGGVPRGAGTPVPREAGPVPRGPSGRAPGSCCCCGGYLRGTNVPRGAGGVPRGTIYLPRGDGNLVRGIGHHTRCAGHVVRGAGPVPRGRGRVRPSVALFAALQRRRK